MDEIKTCEFILKINEKKHFLTVEGLKINADGTIAENHLFNHHVAN